MLCYIPKIACNTIGVWLKSHIIITIRPEATNTPGGRFYRLNFNSEFCKGISQGFCWLVLTDLSLQVL